MSERNAILTLVFYWISMKTWFHDSKFYFKIGRVEVAITLNTYFQLRDIPFECIHFKQDFMYNTSPSELVSYIISPQHVTDLNLGLKYLSSVNQKSSHIGIKGLDFK